MVCGCLALGVAPDCRAQVQTTMTADQPAPHALPPDAALPTHQDRLLTIAFEAASALPVTPHLKTRSTMQESVIAACLELDQPRRAQGYVEQIDNWLRGSAYADLAWYCARHASPGGVQHFVDLASEVAQQESDWRRDQIRTKIAQTFIWLRQEEIASGYASGAASSEASRVEAARAMRAESSEFDVRLEALQGALASGDFDLMRGALEACTILFERFYAEQEQRERLERTIRLYAEQVPVTVRLDLWLTLAQAAIAHEDLDKARSFVTQARSYLEAYGWQSQDKVPYMARIARVQHLAGATVDAERELNAAIALYFTDRHTIITTSRAKALWPIAEAYQAMGRTREALGIYARALEEAAANPNGRPRSMDLVTGCLSMALNNVEPDEAMWERIDAMREGLSAPW